MPRNSNQNIRDRARESRKNPSAAEAIMWQSLRGNKTGFKFRREHPVGNFRLDFFCAEAMLAVEMDGEQHDPIRDQVRDQILRQYGILTYRISNRRFFGLDHQPIQDELEAVIRLCEERSRKFVKNTC